VDLSYFALLQQLWKTVDNSWVPKILDTTIQQHTRNNITNDGAVKIKRQIILRLHFLHVHGLPGTPDRLPYGDNDQVKNCGRNRM